MEMVVVVVAGAPRAVGHMVLLQKWFGVGPRGCTTGGGKKTLGGVVSKLMYMW